MECKQPHLGLQTLLRLIYLKKNILNPGHYSSFAIEAMVSPKSIVRKQHFQELYVLGSR